MSDEKMVTRVEMRCSEEFKADAKWAAGRHEQELGPWIKSLVLAAVRKEKALEARAARALRDVRRRREDRARRAQRRPPAASN